MRKIKKILIFILVLSLFAGMFCINAIAAEEIEYESSSVIVTEIVSGTTIISQQPDTKIDPGAFNKMVALYVISKACFNGQVSLDDEITITNDVMKNDYGTIPLKNGEVFTLEQLMYLFYMDYSDTAAYAAALHTSGTYEAFIAEMNGVLKLAGCENTVCSNVTGYYSEDQWTTPTDIVSFLKLAIQNTIFYNIFSAVTYEIPENELSLTRSLVTENLVQRVGSKYGTTYCVGGKQGGHTDTGYVTVTLSERNAAADVENGTQMKLIVITAGAQSSDSGYADAYNLIKWTFDNFSWNTILYRGEAVEHVPVDLANGTDYIVVGPENDVTALLDNSITPTDFERKITIYPPENGENYTAPISRGQIMGELELIYNGEVFSRVSLVANSDIRLRHWDFFKSEIRKSFIESKLIWVVVAFVAMIAAYIAYTVLFWRKRIMEKQRIRSIKQKLANERRGVAEKDVVVITNESTVKDNITDSDTDDAEISDNAENN